MCFEASNIQKVFICIFITIGSGIVSLYDCSCKILSSVRFSALLKLNQSLSLGYWKLELLGSVRALLKKMSSIDQTCCFSKNRHVYAASFRKWSVRTNQKIQLYLRLITQVVIQHHAGLRNILLICINLDRPWTGFI